MKNKKRLRWMIILTLMFLVALVILLGPRISTNVVVPKVNLQDDISQYLSQSESGFKDVIPGTEKKVNWNGAPGIKTRISVLYLHGFTGSRQELVPAIDMIAEELNANLFYNRYTGHGRGAEAMAEPTLQDWVDDTAEALAIGRRIGKKTATIAMSTSAALAAWLCSSGDSPDILVMLSPNFGPADRNAELLLLPWGNLIVKLAVGKYYQADAKSERNARYSTTRYRSEALLTMMASVELGRRCALEKVKVPLLCLYSSKDDVVAIPKMVEAFERIGSNDKTMHEIKSARGHVLGGDTHSPESTEELVRAIVDFINSRVNQE